MLTRFEVRAPQGQTLTTRTLESEPADSNLDLNLVDSPISLLLVDHSSLTSTNKLTCFTCRFLTFLLQH